MKLKNIFVGAAALAGVTLATGLTSQANAALIGTFEGNDCAGALGGSFSQCSYQGSPIIAKFDASGSVEINTGFFPTITGAEFSFTSLTSGTGSWTYTPGAGDPLITVYAAKGGNAFNLFSNDGDPNSGSWFTPINNGGQTPNLSHISFYDTAAPPVSVPEPSSMLILGAALLGLGAAARRRAA